MRAYQLPQATGIDALVKVDLPTAKPDPPQILIKVAACSLNFRDLAIALGTYRMPMKPNLVPLSDGAGEVGEIGTGVTRVKVCDRTVGGFFQRWPGGPPTADTHSSPWAAASMECFENTQSSKKTASSSCPLTCRSRKVQHCHARR